MKQTKPIPLILTINNINNSFDVLSSYKKEIENIKNNSISFEKGSKLFDEILGFLKNDDSSFNKALNELNEFQNIYNNRTEYLILLKYKLNNIFEEIFIDYPYLYKLSGDFEELLALKYLPFDEIYQLNHALKISHQTKLYSTDIADYKTHISKSTLRKILFHTLNFIIKKVAIELYFFKLNLDSKVFDFEMAVLWKNGNYAKPAFENLPKSFSYKYWNDSNTGSFVMEDAYNKLINNNFISKETKYRDFSNIFRSKKNTTPLVWTGLKSDLAFFIKLLHTKYKIIENHPKSIYKIAKELFVDSDGNKFETEKFKSDKPTLNAEKLEEIVKALIPPNLQTLPIKKNN